MKLSDLQPDNRNANKGTTKGRDKILGSLKAGKFGRSVLLDKNGKIIAGNKSIQAAAEVLGPKTKVTVIKSNGDEIIAHQREDLDLDDPDPNNPARALAYFDNITSRDDFDLDTGIVLDDLQAGFDFDGILSDDELFELQQEALLEDEIATALLSPPSENGRALTYGNSHIRPAIHLEEIGLFEQALRATGLQNRGDAVIAICRYFLDAEGQFDL